MHGKARYYTYIKGVQELPRGLKPSELIELVKEFRENNLTNKNKFIHAYTRLTIHRCLCFTRRKEDADDMVAVGLLALNEVPAEVKDRLIDDNIVAYSMCRVRTKCLDHIRKNHNLYVPIQARLNGVPPPTYDELGLEKIYQEDKSDKELRELIDKCVVTEFDRILVDLLSQGYDTKDVAQLLSCSQQKVSKYKVRLEERFNEYVSTVPEFRRYGTYSRWSKTK